MKPVSDAATAELPPLAPGDWARFLDHAIARRFDELVAPRRHLHGDPEPSGRGFQTSAYLDPFPAPHDFEIRRGPERRGLTVDPPRMAAAPRIAIRADLDQRARAPGVRILARAVVLWPEPARHAAAGSLAETADG